MGKGVYVVLTAAVVALLLGLTLVACGGQPETQSPASLDGEALVKERCSKCHGLDKVEQAAKAQDAWKTTVERMVGKGAQLSDTEQTAVVEYLAKQYPAK